MIARRGFEPGRAVARRAGALVLTVLTAASCSACGSSVFSAGAPRTLAHAASSPEALIANLTDAIARDDVEAARRLRLTKDEFCRYVFPELPSSKLPNVTCDFVWEQATLKSLGGLSRVLDQHRGRRYTVKALRYPGPPDLYATFVVHKAPFVTLEDERGATTECRIGGSILEMDGQFKLFSFVID